MRETQGHHRYIDRALELAAKATGSTFPNPLVGAVIVRDGEVIGEGYHRRAGSAHAEIEALSAAGTSAEGATLYLNLEPCCHCGRTGPCTDAILEAGIAEVVFSIHDPDPRVKGQGASILRKAGVEVVTGIRAAEAVELNLPFIHRTMTGKPLIVLKLALTLDGKLTAPGRERLTGEEAARRVHTLRGRHQAIAVGSGTLRTDVPLLDRRLLGPGVPPPVRMVFDTRLETAPPDSWDIAADRAIWFCSGEASSEKRSELEDLGVEVVSLPSAPRGIDLDEWRRSV
ncbi:MAG TPA: bifunctional diaminohydroxyphosphoribosylaminopyrimidine deaminase/5-amino-6-(5-phosphoribosylamino)uracil reductase RibD, partial [Candidatus Krumholzibacterium sp.]|nr:bifunctional diaminohydroxyphosphoribosylaminopyrimidine deaminase/5-amino-6-(5-phosphoribosylamino)uracil reductase RibD [Candidatus Krumholzibacterium sp.]